MPQQIHFKLSREEKESLKQSVSSLESVRLGSPYVYRFPGQISVGEKRRVAIARAFAEELQEFQDDVIRESTPS